MYHLKNLNGSNFSGGGTLFFGVVGALLGYNYEKREALAPRVPHLSTFEYEATRSKRSGSTRGEKCPKTNLESQVVLCEAYTLIGVYIIYYAQMAHI